MPAGGAMDIPKLSVVVPVYNERATIHLIVEKLRAVPLPMEIIAVNVCSKDGSAEILDRLKAAEAPRRALPRPVDNERATVRAKGENPEPVPRLMEAVAVDAGSKDRGARILDRL